MTARLVEPPLRLDLPRKALELLCGAGLAALVGPVVVWAVSRLDLVEPSWLARTLSGTVGVLLLAAVAAVLLTRPRPRLLWATGVLAPAVLASTHLALLLHGTPHYLFGLGGDQANRVPYLGRLADSPALHDPFYAGAAPFYPPGWFWVCGRLADLTGVPAWEAYKPLAVATMAAAGAMAFVTWRWVTDSRVAVVLGLVTSVVGLHTAAYEPYSWILVCLLPLLAGAALRMCGAPARSRDGLLLALVVGLWLGGAALTYTLIAGFAAAVVGGMCGVTALVALRAGWRARAVAIVARLAVAAAVSGVVALLFWHRYLLAVLSGAGTEKSVANDFAPESGASWPLPMLEVSASGLLCLIGVGWLVAVLARRCGDVHAALVLGALCVAVALWFLLSGLRALTGSTLLPFRMIPVLTLALSCAGVFGAVELARWARDRSAPHNRSAVRAVAVAVALLCGVQLVQHVSPEDVEFAAAARATPGEPTAVLDAVDRAAGGLEPDRVVLLTCDPALLAYRPYYSFEAPAAAYATPTGRYAARLDEVRRWAAEPDGAALADAMTHSPFRAPDVLVLREESPEAWTWPAVVNTMPRSDNNGTEQIAFPPRLFDDPHFAVEHVEGLAVVARHGG